MDTATFNVGPFAGVGREIFLAEVHALTEEGSGVSLAKEAKPNLSRAPDQPNQPEKASALFRATHDGAAPYLAQQKAEPHPALPSPKEQDSGVSLPRGKRIFSEESQSTSPMKKKQRTGTTTWRALSLSEVGYIFRYLGMQDKIAFSMACKSFRRASQLYDQRRCTELLASDAESHLFERFGIVCPGGATPNPGQLKAMIARVNDILELTKDALLQLQFQEELLPSYTTEELVLRAPPAGLQTLLEVAYQCELYTPARRLTDPPHATPPVEAGGKIQTLLGSEQTSKADDELVVHQTSLTCLPFETSWLANFRKLPPEPHPARPSPY